MGRTGLKGGGTGLKEHTSPADWRGLWTPQQQGQVIEVVHGGGEEDTIYTPCKQTNHSDCSVENKIFEEPLGPAASWVGSSGLASAGAEGLRVRGKM